MFYRFPVTDRQTITDPARIRALAHPLRLELLEFLGDVGEATATECAEHLGESAASCSYHLHMLAKYGFVEPAERRGREKPWRNAQQGFDMRPDPDHPESGRALQETAVFALERQAERLRTFFAQAHREPDEWIQASTMTATSFWATSDELAELSDAIQHLTDRFAGRSANPDLRPPGARQARLFAAANPEPRPTTPEGDPDGDH